MTISRDATQKNATFSEMPAEVSMRRTSMSSSYASNSSRSRILWNASRCVSSCTPDEAGSTLTPCGPSTMTSFSRFSPRMTCWML